MMAISVDNFWSTPHAQVYREVGRLAEGGHLTERREERGRRRRFYAITDRGRAALEAWRHQAPEEHPQLRDPGVLKLFFGGEPSVVAAHQLGLHEAKLAEYEALCAQVGDAMPVPQRRALDLGVAHERAMIAIWRDVALEDRRVTSGPRA
ncbi:PadR family transcriptional regulator [Baekduia soli]|uniref:PadR family transcriptional regulator n=2 Tax=Baekduia soli TaxID=496014 RepID=A0A5B8UCI3_9ACTN|nr:PadR family transcriptional regulator [Baekduia soli]